MKINWKYFAGSLFALLGFAGCQKGLDDGDGRGMLCMYGQPTAHYKLMGNVKGPDGKPVGGIRAVFIPVQDKDYTYRNDTLYTDSRGHFEKEQLKHTWPDDLKEAKLILEDVDGADNGSFKTQTLSRNQLQVKQTKKGDGNWFHGDYSVSADVTLEKAD